MKSMNTLPDGKAFPPTPNPSPPGAGLSHMAEISSVCARIERSVLAKGNFGIRKCVAATDPNPKIPYAIPLRPGGEPGQTGLEEWLREARVRVPACPPLQVPSYLATFFS